MDGRREEIEEILSRLSDGLSREDVERLRSLCADDAELKHVVEAHLRLHAVLQAMHGADEGTVEETARAVREAFGVPGGAVPTGRAFRRIMVERMRRSRPAPGWVIGMLAAAAIVVAVALGVLFSQRGGSPEPVRFAETEPEEAGPAPLESRPAEVDLPEVEEPPMTAAEIPEAQPAEVVLPDGIVTALRDDGGKEDEDETEGSLDVPVTPAGVSEAGAIVAMVEEVTGTARFQRRQGSRLFELKAGIRLVEGDRVECWSGTAVLKARGESVVCLNQWSTVVVEDGGIRLAKGELFCHGLDRGKGPWIETSDGRFRHIGTSFLVKISGGYTSVVVVDGEVMVQNEEGEAKVTAGYEVTVNQGRAPSRPRKVDAEKAAAWAIQGPMAAWTSLRKGLIGYWKFDEGSGETAKDETPNAFHGKVTGAAWVAGVVGNALDFDGSDDCVDIGDPPQLRLTDAMTLAAWILVDGFQGNGRIVCKQDGPGKRGWSLNIERQKYVCIQVPIDTDTTVATKPPTFPEGRWVHVIGVFNPGREICTYLDGKLADRVTDGVPVKQFNSALPVRIGGRPEGGCFFDGRIDEVRIYNRALSAEEAKALYRLSK